MRGFWDWEINICQNREKNLHFLKRVFFLDNNKSMFIINIILLLGIL